MVLVLWVVCVISLLDKTLGGRLLPIGFGSTLADVVLGMSSCLATGGLAAAEDFASVEVCTTVWLTTLVVVGDGEAMPPQPGISPLTPGEGAGTEEGPPIRGGSRCVT